MNNTNDIVEAVLALYAGDGSVFEEMMKTRGWGCCSFETSCHFADTDYQLAQSWAAAANEPLVLFAIPHNSHPSSGVHPHDPASELSGLDADDWNNGYQIGVGYPTGVPREVTSHQELHDEFAASCFAITTPNQAFIMLHIIEDLIIFAKTDLVMKRVADSDFWIKIDDQRLDYWEYTEFIRKNSAPDASMPSAMWNAIARMCQFRKTH